MVFVGLRIAWVSSIESSSLEKQNWLTLADLKSCFNVAYALFRLNSFFDNKQTIILGLSPDPKGEGGTWANYFPFFPLLFNIVPVYLT